MTEQVQVPEDDEINLWDLLQVVADNLRLLVLGPLAVGLVALGYAFTIKPTFTAETRFLPPQQQQSAAAAMLQSLGGLGGLAGAAASIKNPNDQFVAILKSRTLQDTLIDRFDLMNRYKQGLKDDTRRVLSLTTRISAGKDNLIDLEVDDHDPAFAAALANAYVEEFRKLLGKLALTEAQQRRAFFENQLAQTKDKLVQAEQALRDTGVNSSALKSSPEAAIGAIAQLQAQIAAQEIKLASMRGYLTESAPDFRQAQTELSALRSQLAKAGKPSGNGKADDADYIARYRDFKYYATLFELFAKQYELARADEAREGNVIQVVDVAVPPERRSKPKRAQMAVLAALGSGILLLLFVFARHTVLRAVQSPEFANRLDKLRAAVIRAIRLRSE